MNFGENYYKNVEFIENLAEKMSRLNRGWGSNYKCNTDKEIFDSIREQYFKDEEEKYKIKQVNKIKKWFLKCKYNPKYKYCRDKLEAQYKEMYVE